MAYDSTKLECVTNGEFRCFQYSSTDAPATVNTDGYVSDGQTRGMRVGDTMEQMNKTSGLATKYTVLSLSTSNNSVDLTDGTTVSIATDTD